MQASAVTPGAPPPPLAAHAGRRAHDTKTKGPRSPKSPTRPTHQHDEGKKRRRAVQELVMSLSGATSSTTPTAGFTPEALICSYPRFVPPDTMMRIMKRVLVSETNGDKSIGLLRILSVWVKLRGEKDFRRGSTRLESLVALMDRVAARAPKLGLDGNGDTHPLLLAINRVKLGLIAALGNCLYSPSSSSSPSFPSTSGSSISVAPGSPMPHRTASLPAISKSDSAALVVSARGSPPIPSDRSPLAFKRNPIAARATALKLFSFTPTQIAEELTRVDHELFSAIPLEEFLEKRWEDKTRPSKLRDFIERSNNLSDWVASHILVQTTLSAQTHVVQLFIEVCKWCEAMGNFYSCSGIFGGFNKWCTSRLTKTWKIKHSHKLLHAHVHLVISEEKNYSNYRTRLAEKLRNAKPCVPHVAVFLRDLTFVEDGNLDFVNGEPNVKKISLIGDIVEQIRSLQVTRFSLDDRATDPFLAHRLRTLPRRDEAWLEKRSLELRPMASNGAEDTSFASASTRSDDSSDDRSVMLEDVADLSEVSSHSAGNSGNGSGAVPAVHST